LPLPPVEQVYTVAAAEYLAGVNEMMARTDELAASINAVAASSERMAGVADTAASSVAGADRAATVAADQAAVAIDAMAVSADRAAVALDAQMAAADRSAVALDGTAAAADRAGVASEGAGAKAGLFGSHGKTAFLAVAGAVGYSIVKAAEYQSRMTRLLTQAGVAKSQFKELSQGVLQLAGQIGQSPTSLAESLYHIESNFSSLGITAPKALNLVKIAAEGANVGGADLVDVTNALTAAVASGIPGVKNMSGAMGMLNAIVGSGDMKMQDLADAFGSGMVAVVKGYGLSLRDVGAALATFGDNNVRGAHAGTMLRMAVQALAVPAKAGVAQLAAMGMTASQMASDMEHGGLLKGLDDLAAHLHKAGYTARTEGAAITQIFGKKAGPGVAMLIEQLNRLQSKYPAITKGAHDFGKAWKTTQGTVQQQFKDFKSGLSALADSFGTILLPAVTKVLGYINKFLGLLEKHPALAAFAGAIVALGAAMGIAATATAALDAALAINPIVLAVIAVIALAAGLYELYKHCAVVRKIVSDVAHFFEGAWKGAMHIAGEAIKWFTSGPLAFIKQQIAQFRAWWSQNSKEIEQVWHAVWAQVKLIVEVAWAVIKAEVRVGLATLKALWNIGWGLIRDTVKLVWNTMAVTIRTAIKVIEDIIAVVLDVITGHWSKAWHDILKLSGDVAHGVVNIVRTVLGGLGHLLWDLAVNAVRGFIGGIRSMFGAVGSVVSSLAHGVVSWFTGASPNPGMHSAGLSAGNSLASGLQAASGAVAAAAYNLGAGARAAATAGLAGGGGLGSEVHALAVYKAASAGAALGQALTSGLTSALQGAGGSFGGGGGGGGPGGGGGGGVPGAIAGAVSAAQRKAATLAKVMHDIGLMLARGFARAIGTDSAAQVKSAVDKLLGYVRQAFNAGGISFAKASRMTEWITDDNNRLQALAARRTAILKTIAAAQKYASSTAASVQSWAGITGLSSVSAASGGGSVLYSGNILADLQAKLSGIRNFAGYLRRLAKLGLSKGLLNQIIQAGPDQGSQIALALLNGPLSVIRSMNATQTQIDKASRGLGRTAAELMYDSGKQAGKGFLSGLEHQRHAITKLMDKIARDMVRALREALGISSPSKVAIWHGQMFAQGLAIGLDSGHGQITASAMRLAEAMASGRAGGAGGGTGAGGGQVVNHYHFEPHIQGFIGSEQQLAQHLMPMIQRWILQVARRNPGNMLSLNQGRFG
jgi:TP901 family phage tail tape measure protein